MRFTRFLTVVCSAEGQASGFAVLALGPTLCVLPAEGRARLWRFELDLYGRPHGLTLQRRDEGEPAGRIRISLHHLANRSDCVHDRPAGSVRRKPLEQLDVCRLQGVVDRSMSAAKLLSGIVTPVAPMTSTAPVTTSM
jgi:hypothetical protein